MKSIFRSAWFVLIAALCLATSLAPDAYGQRQTDSKNSAVKPVPRDGGWMKRHESMNKRAKQGDVDLVFIGDSITQGWEGNGKDVWKKFYGDRKAMNLGISGDRTQHVLWRLENGNIEGIQPKLAVIMIGTNNSNNKDNTAEEIADGIKAIVAKLRDKLPETKILLLAVFPRGAMTDAQLTKSIAKAEKKKPEEGELADKIAAARDYTKSQRQKLTEVNQSIAKLADDKSIFYLDIGPKFMEADGTLPDDVMPDHLHLSPKGYEIWAEAIEPKVKQLLDNSKAKADGKQAKTDAQQLQGSWKAIRYTADGETIDPSAAPVRWVFTDNMFRLLADVEEASPWGKFKLDADKTPHTIDLTFAVELGAAKAQTALGVYDLTDKQFKICYATEGAQRPSQFGSKAGSNLVEIVFEKVVM